MKKNGAKRFVIGLVPDGILLTFEEATRNLVNCIQGRADYIGSYEKPRLGYAIIEVRDESVLAELQERAFVSRLPVPGIEKDITREEDFRLHYAEAVPALDEVA